MCWLYLVQLRSCYKQLPIFKTQTCLLKLRYLHQQLFYVKTYINYSTRTITTLNDFSMCNSLVKEQTVMNKLIIESTYIFQFINITYVYLTCSNNTQLMYKKNSTNFRKTLFHTKKHCYFLYFLFPVQFVYQAIFVYEAIFVDQLIWIIYLLSR